MTQPLDYREETPSQTAGPYVHIGLIPSFTGNGQIYEHELGKSPIQDGAKGQIIEVVGSVFDGTGWAMRDVLIESWQADAAGVYPGQIDADPAVSGFCRLVAEDEGGEFRLRTIKPGPVRMRGGLIQSPHISLWIVARGINIGLSTRLYFEDEDNSNDPLLARIEQRQRIQTLIAKKIVENQYRFDIRLQGEGETVFLDI
ncbi:MAG: protocatechuate 3,4-dioxygenase subunit alpha [Pseudomonadota bacterium]